MKKIFFVTLFFLTIQNSWGTTLWVEPLTGSSVSETDLKTITDLVQTASAETEGYELASGPSEAKVILRGKAIKLGDSYVISLEKYVNNKRVFASKMKALTMNELDEVSTRIVRATLSEKNVEKDARVSDLTKNESIKGTLRREAVRQWEFSFGPAVSYGLNTSNNGINWRFGYVWGVDPQFDIRLAWEFLSVKNDGDTNFTDANIGVNYFFTDTNTSFYLTGDIGYGRATAHQENNKSFFGSDDNVSSFMGSLGVGVKFFRVSNVNLGLQLRHSQMLEKTDISNKHPGVTGLTLSVYF